MSKNISINIDEETLQELKFLGCRFGISSTLSLSQYIQQVIFRCYLSEVESAADPPIDPPIWHGFVSCGDDCEHCPDEPIFDYSTAIDNFII